MTGGEPAPDSSAGVPIGIPTDDLANLFDSGPLGFIATDEHDGIVAANSTALRWLGYERDALVGKESLQSLLTVGDRIYYETHVRPLLHIDDEVREIALTLVAADGTRLPVLVNAVRALDTTTGLQRTDAVIFDARDRRRYESELLRERQSAEHASQRIQLLYDIVSGLANAQTIDEVVDVVTDRGERSMSGARCAVWTFGGDELLATRVGSESRWNIDSVNHLEIPDDAPGLGALRAGELLVIADATAEGALDRYPLIGFWMSETGQGSVVVAPLIIDGDLRGVLTYGFADAREFSDDDLVAVSSLAEQAAQAMRRAWLADADRRSRARLESLYQFTSTLSAAIDLDDVVDVLVATGIDLIGATTARVALVGPAGTVDLVGVDDEFGPTTLDLDCQSIGCAAIREGTTVVTTTRAELVERYPDSEILIDGSPGRVVAVPLHRGVHVIGAWVLSFEDEGEPAPDDVKLILLAAEQASEAARRAAFHEAEVLARRQFELRHTISVAMNRAVTTADVGAALTDMGRTAFGATAIMLYTLDEGDWTSLDLVVHVGLTEEQARAAGEQFPTTPALKRAFAALAPVFIERDGQIAAVRNVLPRDLADGAVALLPLVHGGHALGVIVVFFTEVDELDTTTRVVLSGVAAEASVVIGRARQYETEHRVAVTLQRSMLPTDAPVVEGWNISTAFRPGSEQLLVGGDLFDVTASSEGRVTIVVGDVVGHGLIAAASMGQLRSAAKALALLGKGPKELLDGLDDFARLTPGARYSSVACVVIEPDGKARYACAGHPFPMLVRAGGEVDVLEHGRSPLLAITGTEPRSDAATRLRSGDTLLLYTDGLIERRLESIEDGMVRLVRRLGSVDLSGAEAADRVVDVMTRDARGDDDIVAICINRE